MGRFQQIKIYKETKDWTSSNLPKRREEVTRFRFDHIRLTHDFLIETTKMCAMHSRRLDTL